MTTMLGSSEHSCAGKHCPIVLSDFFFFFCGYGDIFKVLPNIQGKLLVHSQLAPERHRGYSVRHQQPRIDAASHQAKSLILISGCVRARYVLSVIHDAATEGLSRSAAAVFSQKSRKCPISPQMCFCSAHPSCLRLFALWVCLMFIPFSRLIR